jgi:hypothetical protein
MSWVHIEVVGFCVCVSKRLNAFDRALCDRSTEPLTLFSRHLEISLPHRGF